MLRIVAVTVALVLGSQQAGSLSVELSVRNLPVPPNANDLHWPITSYSALDDARGFVIAYYGQAPDGLLHELRIRSYDKATQTWRVLDLKEPIGSVVSIHRGGGFLFVAGHSSPSAAPTLVLTELLSLKRELDGWPELVLPDGRIFFHRSMIHFAPTHAAVLALYDPRSDREVNVYPANAARIERGIEREGEYQIDRSIDGVKQGSKPDTIEFQVVEQRMRLDQNDRGVPASPEQRFTIVCDLAASPIACSRKPRFHPDVVGSLAFAGFPLSRSRAESAEEPRRRGMLVDATGAPDAP